MSAEAFMKRMQKEHAAFWNTHVVPVDNKTVGEKMPRVAYLQASVNKMPFVLRRMPLLWANCSKMCIRDRY